MATGQPGETGTLSVRKSSKEGEIPKVATLTFLAPSEIDTIARQVAEMLKENPKSKIR